MTPNEVRQLLELANYWLSESLKVRRLEVIKGGIADNFNKGQQAGLERAAEELKKWLRKGAEHHC